MGNRNKKSNLRKIIVDEQLYYWTVNSPNCDGDGHFLMNIWKDKVKIYSKVQPFGEITPKNVREKILELIK